MKKQKVKRFWATLLAIGVVITTVFPGTTYADEIGTQISEPVKVEEQSDPVEDGEEQTDSEVKPAGDSNILLLSSETVPEDTLGAVAVEQLAGAVRLTYESAEMSKNAFDVFTAMGIACEYDTQVEMLDKEPEKVEELNPAETPTEDVAVVEELKEEPVAVESASKEKSVKVAVIDTGCDLNVIFGRIADGTDMSVTDVNGHGTLMTEIIASQTTEKVKILPIKAFDDNGYSTVGQVYDAIMRAIDLEADVINLSMSGAGTSQMLTHAINKATEKGIIVVVSAGNDASDVEGFMPGNIDTAITVSATDRNEVFAEYSNFGEKIDYSAVGEIIKDQGTEDTSDDVYYNGTSIAAAFVSGYVACVKDNNLEADILGTFDKYAKDLGSAGRDDCYGRGFLTLENIKFDISKEEPDEENKEEINEEKNNTDIDADEKTEGGKKGKEQTLKVSANPNGKTCLVWDGDFAKNIANLYAKNVKSDTEYLFGGKDSKAKRICIYKNGYTESANNGKGTYTKYSNASSDRNSAFKALLYYLEKDTTTCNVFLQTNVTCTETINIKNNKGLHGYGYTLVQNYKGPDSFIKKSDASYNNYEGHPLFHIHSGGNLKLVHTHMKGQAALGRICSAYDTTGKPITKWYDDEHKTANNNLTKTVNGVKNIPQYSATYNGISSEGTLTVYNSRIRLFSNAISVQGGTFKIYGSYIYKNKGNGITCAGSSTKVEIYGAKVDRNGQTSSAYNDNAYADAGKYKDFMPYGSRAYSGISPHSPITIGDWTCPGKNNAILHTISSSNERYGVIMHSDAVAGTSNCTGLICEGNYNDGYAIFAATTNFNNCSFNNNLDKGLNVKEGATAVATNITVTGNAATGLTNAGTLTINGCGIYSNQNHGISSSGTATINSGSFYSNKSHGVNSSGSLTINGGNFYSNGKSGVNSTGTLTIKGGCFRNNFSHGVAIGGGTANIYGGNFGTYSTDGGKTWVTNAGNINSGIRTKKATTNVYGGVFSYNKNGLECQSGTTTLSGGDIYGNTTYGVYNNGTFKMTGGKVRDNDDNGTAAGGNKVQGIFNTQNAILTINGGTINGNKDGILNWGDASITNGSIKSNENGILNEKSGTTTVDGTGVNITGNTRGIQNTSNEKGSVTVNSANIKENTTADISQSGETFTISGSNTKAKTIELGVKDGKCEVVTLDGVPAETKKVIFKSKIAFEEEYKSLPNGETKAKEAYQKNMSAGRPMFKCINTTPKAILDSGKLELQSGQKTLMGNGTKKDAIMRSFKGSNMNESLAGGNIAEKDKYIVLSTKYAGIYKVNEVLDGVKFEIPDLADIFWNEDNHIKMPELWATIGGVLKKFDIIGWLKDGEGNPVSVGSIMAFLFGESNKDHEIVAKLGAVNLYVNGNGQSDGEDYVIEEFNCTTDILPENTFEKEFLDDYYYIELGEQKRHETKYTYQGWSLSDDATYQDEGVMQPQGKLDYADVLTYIDSHKDSITYGDNGLPNIPIYVVWDKYPELEAKEIGFAEMELDQSLNLSDADSVYLDDKGFASVLYERVVGTDDEDGVLTNGAEEKGVICEDSIQDLRAELLSFEHTGATTVTFKATDGVGNVTERRVRVWINRGNPIEEAYINRARVINRKYYDIGKEYADKLVEDNKNRPENEKIGSYEINVARMLLTGKLDRSDAGDVYIEAHKDENPALYYMTGFNHGGLMPIDMWYTDPEYRKCIEEAFDNRENDTPEYSWKFTHEQVLETQEYVETYGISTSEHQDALWNYFNKYKSSFKKLK